MAPDNPMPFEELASRLSGLCERAAARGVTFGVEPCAWTNVGTLDDALALIDASGATNTGLFLDLWHLHRRKLDLGRIASLRPG